MQIPEPQIVLLRNVFSNLGDQAMLQCEVENLRREFPRAQLTVLTDDPAAIGRLCGVNTDFSDVVLAHPLHLRTAGSGRRWLEKNRQGPISQAGMSLLRFCKLVFLRLSGPLFVWNARRTRAGKQVMGLWAPARKLLRRLGQADVVIAGGGLIPRIPNLYLPRIATYRALAALEKPFLVHGLTVHRAPELDGVYRLASRIVVRDRIGSRQNALACGVSEAQILDGIDPAFTLPAADSGEVVEELRSLGLDPARGSFLAINVRSAPGTDIDGPLQSLAASATRYCVENGIGAILLFSMQRHPDEDDMRVILRLKKRLAAFPAIQVLEQPGASLLKGILGQAHCAIVCRYHAAVFALTQGTPAIGLSVSDGYTLKLRGIFQLFGVEEFVQPLAGVTAGSLYESLSRIGRERQTLEAKLRRTESTLRAGRRVAYDGLRTLLEQRNAPAEAHTKQPAASR